MAFAAVDSLRHTFWSLSTPKITISERDELKLLLFTLERLDDSCYRGIDRSEINELEAKIRDAAWKLQDVLESYQISLGVDLKGVEQEIRYFFKTAEKLRIEYERVLQNSCVAVAEEDHIIHNHIAANSTTVGLSDLSKEIINGLLDDKSDSKLFTIWGMAGLGKTHLARDIYHHPLIVQRFKLRLWVSIGPNHKDIENIYVDILAQISSTPRDRFKGKSKNELRDLLWNSLLHRTYIIVFDDVWNMSVLGDCIDALPFEHDRGILMTTRLLDETEEWDGNKICQMPFLSDEESWNLLCQNVFAEKPFPAQLEKAGRKIAEICEGLPLLILAVADILRGLGQTEKCWNMVAEKKTTTFPDAYDRIYKVLVLSYDYLLQKYKACFLYMGVFRQSQEISVPRLINLWAAEDWYGDHQTIKVLWWSSLVIRCKIPSYSDKWVMKSCKLHSAYWYVCVTEARKIKLFHVLIKLTDVSTERPRRLSVQNNMFGIKKVYDSMAESTSLTRSLLFTGENHQYPVHISFNTMLLMKVLDALAIRFYEFPNEVLNLLQLSYLSLTHNREVPSSISKLQRLRFLTLRRHHNIKVLHRDSTTCLPNEIWDLEELWYLRVMGSKLPDPSDGVGKRGLSRLYVNADSCTEGVFKSIPHLEKLGIENELQPDGGCANSLRCLEHIGLLNRLESLKCVVVNPRLSSQAVAQPDHLSNLPRSLQKLSLNGMGYPWEYMSAISSLPYLKVLKLRCSAFRGPQWEIKFGHFPLLHFLLLEDLDVVHWTVGQRFRFRRLTVRHCYKLNMRTYMNWPSMKILGMKRIEVDDCSPSVVEFAQQLKDKYSPSRLTVVIDSSWNL